MSPSSAICLHISHQKMRTYIHREITGDNISFVVYKHFGLLIYKPVWNWIMKGRKVLLIIEKLCQTKKIGIFGKKFQEYFLLE